MERLPIDVIPVTQMLGVLPGVPPMHITYVHLTIASLL